MVKLSDIELPVIFKNQLLFKAGNWNRLSFSNQMVDSSVGNTKWSSLNKRLYLKHENQYDISQWKGSVDNILSKNGEVRGDVAIWDGNEALQIVHGKKPIAISADIEYNDAGVMYFTGFALEADPGIRDSAMFLSDSVKNELNGMFHASFSNQIDATSLEIQEASQTNVLDTQSTERRLEIKHDAKMENENKPSEVQPSVHDVAVQETIKALEAKVAELSAKVDVKPTPAPIVESTPVPQALPTIPMDEKSIANMIDKIAERIKPISVPTPMTIAEMGTPVIDSEDETINRLAKSLAN